MRIAYAAMLWLLRNELRIARKSGRNPQNISKLCSEVQDYELLLAKESMKYGP